jgi:hypothetical protein
MTVTDLTPTRTRRRERRGEPTPESQRLAQLEEMLADPRYAGYREELEAAHAELVALIATSALAA